jgi:SAC3/GANP family
MASARVGIDLNCLVDMRGGRNAGFNNMTWTRDQPSGQSSEISSGVSSRVSSPVYSSGMFNSYQGMFNPTGNMTAVFNTTSTPGSAFSSPSFSANNQFIAPKRSKFQNKAQVFSVKEEPDITTKPDRIKQEPNIKQESEYNSFASSGRKLLAGNIRSAPSAPFPIKQENASFIEEATESIKPELTSMCSAEEVEMRSQTKQIDKFEASLSSLSVLDPQKAVKKYQRSSADKKYLGIEIRTLLACKQTVQYLMQNILDFDINPKPGNFNSAICSGQCDYFDVYSFLRDRLRAVRVDLQVQNSSNQPDFIYLHEVCLHFELLSLYLLPSQTPRSSQNDKKFELQLSLNSVSQTIDPLLNAYKTQNIHGDVNIHKYILLLSLAGQNDKTFVSHIKRIPFKYLSDLQWTLKICACFFNRRFAEVLKMWEACNDFLCCCALIPILDICRVNLLKEFGKHSIKETQGISSKFIAEALRIPYCSKELTEFLATYSIKIEKDSVVFGDLEILENVVKGCLRKEPLLDAKYPRSLTRYKIVQGGIGKQGNPSITTEFSEPRISQSIFGTAWKPTEKVFTAPEDQPKSNSFTFADHVRAISPLKKSTVKRPFIQTELFDSGTNQKEQKTTTPLFTDDELMRASPLPSPIHHPTSSKPEPASPSPLHPPPLRESVIPMSMTPSPLPSISQPLQGSVLNPVDLLLEKSDWECIDNLVSEMSKLSLANLVSEPQREISFEERTVEAKEILADNLCSMNDLLAAEWRERQIKQSIINSWRLYAITQIQRKSQLLDFKLR